MTKRLNRKKESLIEMPLARVAQLLETINEPPYRAQQVKRWLFHHPVHSFEEMKNVPLKIRRFLDQQVVLHPLKLVHTVGLGQSRTKKLLFELELGEQVETVLMQEGKRTTVCVSSQVGCALDCKFCATATMGFLKNLTAGEIVDQVLQARMLTSRRITNVVFMGMGEPLLNYKQVVTAARILNDPEALNLGARRITISTAGVIPGIRRFIDEGLRFKLAISLNAVTQEQREKIMPITKTHPLPELVTLAHQYYQQSHRPVTFEYVLLSQVNDRPEDARQLRQLIGSLPCKLNVIPYNEIGNDFQRPSEADLDAFLRELRQVPFTVTVRRSKGVDIQAGCGQLAVREAAVHA
jgi:23S rRNA (adenine2503-C2)-methyltransferase